VEQIVTTSEMVRVLLYGTAAAAAFAAGAIAYRAHARYV